MSVPVVLVTGFLGAGKTTFINALLQGQHGLRIAAIVNDFGSINIDATLLESASDEVIGLRNGCICCSLQGDLLRTLKRILSTNKPDLIVIEASGVADPQGIIGGLLDPVLWPAVSLDCVVCLVDAEDLSHTPERADDALWTAQVATADVIQLSKVGGNEPAALDALTLRLASMGKRAVFGSDGTAGSLTELLSLAGGPRAASVQPLVQDSGRFRSAEWRCDRPVAMPEFQHVMGRLARELLRAKGFVTFVEKPGKSFLFQLVGQRATVAPYDGAATGCALVLIGERAHFDPDAALSALGALVP